MFRHDIIVIGASAGGVEALTTLTRSLPADLPASIFVVLHVPADSISALQGILARHCLLPVHSATDGLTIEPGHVYVAPPNHHLLVKHGYMRITRGPRENGHRPAIDPLFRSAARAYDSRTIGVILSGMLDDGAEGLLVLKQMGGLTIVQDPEDALFSGMPLSALEYVVPDHILPLARIAEMLVAMVDIETTETTVAITREEQEELEVAEQDLEGEVTEKRPGTSSGLTCPECHGALWEVHEGGMLRYRCRTGHAFSPDTLLSEQTEFLEAALWTALRALEEKASLAQRLADNARSQNRPYSAIHFSDQAKDTQVHIDTLRHLLFQAPVLKTSPIQDASPKYGSRNDAENASEN